MAAEAKTAADQLPRPCRAAFLDGMRKTAETSQTGGGEAHMLSGLPAHLTRQAGQLADQAMRNGLTRAAKEPLIPLVAVLVLGTLAAVAMRCTGTHEEGGADGAQRLTGR